MFDKIKICKEKIDCRGDYYKLRTKIEELIAEKDSFLKNAQLECIKFAKGGYTEFNLSVSAILISALSVFLTIAKEKGIINTIKKSIDGSNIRGKLIFAGIVVFIGFAGIYMHSKKQNASKVLFILNDVEKERQSQSQVNNDDSSTRNITIINHC